MLSITLMLTATHAQTLPFDKIDAFKKDCWSQYLKKITEDPQRQKEMAESAIPYKDSVMKFALYQIGDEPEGGYPLYIALHGGGGTAPEVNDSQWEHMKIYYKSSVKCGIYVATRGVTNTWNLHCVANSYPLYDRLIENCIAFKHVNPNRVYVLGYSAGGDGVYQIASRMSDRFAAANMSAGHPNGISVNNLANLPFLIQLGANDGAYNRNKQAVEYTQRLDAMANLHPGLFPHRLHLHADRSHGFHDNIPDIVPQTIIVDYNGWLAEKERLPRESIDPNAIRWLDRYTRNPIPQHVFWDLSNIADSRVADGKEDAKTYAQFYWLEYSGEKWEESGTKVIEALYNKMHNSVTLRHPANTMRILLNRDMLDLAKPIHLIIDDSFQRDIAVTPNETTIRSTLETRGDPAFMFEAEINIRKTNDTYDVAPTVPTVEKN
ncbi:MAG: hypothetical protein IKZ46_00420 [Victivallales bacterium]|nr:hypothetical protein [Victivallales bacterium]